MATLALVAVAFTPPAEGRMLLLPLDGQPIDRATIEAARATLLSPVPMPGSLVVDKDRRLLSGLCLAMAAPAGLCASG